MQVLDLYCARQGWTFEVVSDLGSRMNYHKKGLTRLLGAIIDGHIGRLVLTHKDRLRLGAVFSDRLYGRRSRKTRKLPGGVQLAVKES